MFSTLKGLGLQARSFKADIMTYLNVYAADAKRLRISSHWQLHQDIVTRQQPLNFPKVKEQQGISTQKTTDMTMPLANPAKAVASAVLSRHQLRGVESAKRPASPDVIDLTVESDSESVVDESLHVLKKPRHIDGTCHDA